MNESVTKKKENRIIYSTEKKSAVKEIEISSQQVCMHVVPLQENKISKFQCFKSEIQNFTINSESDLQ